MELATLCSVLGHRAVRLPSPVARRLGLGPEYDEAEAFGAACRWFEDRDIAPLVNKLQDEVVYEGFLGPFLGFDGELGTLVSLTCYLPFLIADLRVTTLLLLPLLQRGQSRKKGTAGSPFAVADHTRFQHGISGFPDDIPAEDAWQAIVAAARSVGVRMGMIVPLATLAIDSDAIARDPSLVYWWRARPGDLLTGRRTGVSASGIEGEALPEASALGKFVEAPARETVGTVRAGSDTFLRWPQRRRSPCLGCQRPSRRRRW